MEVLKSLSVLIKLYNIFIFIFNGFVIFVIGLELTSIKTVLGLVRLCVRVLKISQIYTLRLHSIEVDRISHASLLVED